MTPSHNTPPFFLQFQTRYPNPLQLQHSFSLFSSNFVLNEAKAYFSLSKLLMRELYYCRDIVLCLCSSMELMLILASYNYVCWDV